MNAAITSSARMRNPLWSCLRHEGHPEHLHDHAPQTALNRCEEMFRQLAADFPDVGIWADRIDHRATRVAVRRLEETVTRLVHGDLPAGRLAALRRAGALPLDAPVLGAEDTAEGMVLPSLREAYVSADFRVAGFGTADRLTSETWWQQQEVRSGLDTFLEGFLTAPKAVEAPVLLLGLPGSGKSLLTKVLAAQLPAEDFLVARLVVHELQNVLTAERAEAGRARRSRTDDSFLYALLSFAACAGRGPVVEFLVEALRPLPPQDREGCANGSWPDTACRRTGWSGRTA
jgi:hypothetical protein